MPSDEVVAWAAALDEQVARCREVLAEQLRAVDTTLALDNLGLAGVPPHRVDPVKYALVSVSIDLDAALQSLESARLRLTRVG